ncbi:MAG: HAMP domain-containing protein [Deltaproteobacteria bacterium]|nr:HAMP domain-containing protein [Deltaproteobacteria bacterium]
MKVATRITVATAVVVALASAIYAFYDLRGRVAERRQALEREAKSVVGTLRATLETQAVVDARDARYRADQLQKELDAVEKKLGEVNADPATPPALPPAEREALVKQQQELQTRLATVRGAAGQGRPLDQALAYRPPAEALLKDLTRASGWRAVVIPRERAADPPGTYTAAQLRRLTTLNDLPQLTFNDVEEGAYFYAVPVRTTAVNTEIQTTAAMLEISKPADALVTTREDLSRAMILVILIVVVTTLMVGALARRLVSRPITKLLSGIDDVAKGDLSHVILSERDDEIGAIATRFNEMTYSLRESRAETQRQNDEKLHLEQRLGQTEKLATIGQLAAEIAHEVGTPLNVIAGRARSIQKKSKDPEAVEKNAEIVAEQTARITRIIQRLLDFTRRKVGAPERAVVNLNELATQTVELLSGQISVAKVKTKVERAEGLPVVAGDPDRLQQVLINLLLNAVQSMPEGGALRIETKVVKRTRPGLETNADQAFVSCVVSDTGVGIPAEIKDKIFDPFYTTKEGSGGTGLGLAVCSGIVKEHDGWIEVDDNSGGGTVFRVFLPA